MKRLIEKLLRTPPVDAPRVGDWPSADAQITWPGPVMGLPVLLLDFDGVLHPGHTGTFEYLPDLYLVLDAIYDLQIVISSDWQRHTPAADLLKIFAPAYRARVVGVIGEETSAEAPRQRAIEAYAAAHSMRGYVAIDDSPRYFDPDCPWLFEVSSGSGISGRSEELVAFIHSRRALVARS